MSSNRVCVETPRDRVHNGELTESYPSSKPCCDVWSLSYISPRSASSKTPLTKFRQLPCPPCPPFKRRAQVTELVEHVNVNVMSISNPRRLISSHSESETCTSKATHNPFPDERCQGRPIESFDDDVHGIFGIMGSRRAVAEEVGRRALGLLTCSGVPRHTNHLHCAGNNDARAPSSAYCQGCNIQIFETSSLSVIESSRW